MSYMRVIPRDLFNEASLLKSMGQVSLLMHDGLDNAGTPTPGGLCWDYDDQAFDIMCSDSGYLWVENLRLYWRGDEVELYRPLNARTPYPLYFNFMTGQEASGLVLDENGNWSADFITACDQQEVGQKLGR